MIKKKSNIIRVKVIFMAKLKNTKIWRNININFEKKISQLIKSHKMIVNIDIKEAIIHTIKLFYL